MPPVNSLTHLQADTTIQAHQYVYKIASSPKASFLQQLPATCYEFVLSMFSCWTQFFLLKKIFTVTCWTDVCFFIRY